MLIVTLFQMYVLLCFALPLLVQSYHINQNFFPVDCQDIFTNGSIHSGVYTIYPLGPKRALQVYCDMGCPDDKSNEDGKWTVCGITYDVLFVFIVSYFLISISHALLPSLAL